MVDPVFNKQNNHVLMFDDTLESKELTHMSMMKHPASVMMLGIVPSTGHKMLLVWFPTRYRLTAPDYLKILRTKVKL